MDIEVHFVPRDSYDSPGGVLQAGEEPFEFTQNGQQFEDDGSEEFSNDVNGDEETTYYQNLTPYADPGRIRQVNFTFYQVVS